MRGHWITISVVSRLLEASSVLIGIVLISRPYCVEKSMIRARLLVGFHLSQIDCMTEGIH